MVGDRIGDASAVKMSTASVYKGTTAVLTQALLAARANGVLEHVLADLERGAPELVSNPGRRVANGATKAARYVGEMREIAETQSRAGLTPALFEAMADVYAALSQTSLARRHPEELESDPALKDVLDELAPLSEPLHSDRPSRGGCWTRKARTQGASISSRYGRDRGRGIVASRAASRHGRSL